MVNLRATDFLARYLPDDFDSWNEAMDFFAGHEHAAKHMAELIDDIEIFGQESPVNIKEGIIEDGHKRVLAMAILGADISYTFAPVEEPEHNSLFVVEIEADSPKEMKKLNLPAMRVFSFRFEESWITPVGMERDEEEAFIVLHCPGGSMQAERIAPVISNRLDSMVPNVNFHAMRIAEFAAPLDDDCEQ